MSGVAEQQQQHQQQQDELHQTGADQGEDPEGRDQPGGGEGAL